jgi:hypothetical protein
MTYLLCRMRAQDRIEGREPDWDENGEGRAVKREEFKRSRK